METLSIGRYLKDKRIKKGLSLKETSGITKIHQSLLFHLESDDFENLPKLIYLRGFVRNLSSILEFDSMEGLALLEKNYTSFMEIFAQKNSFSPQSIQVFYLQLKEFISLISFMMRDFFKLKLVLLIIVSSIGISMFYLLESYFISQKKSSEIVRNESSRENELKNMNNIKTKSI